MPDILELRSTNHKMDRQPPLDPDFISPKAEKDRRAAENSSEHPCGHHHRPWSNSLYIESENWNWDDRSDWRVAGKDWQEFNSLWYGNVGRQLDSDDPSVTLDDGVIERTVIVRSSYVTMFDHIWAQAFGDDDPGNGLIITGQPGTGVSLLSLLHFQNS